MSKKTEKGTESKKKELEPTTTKEAKEAKKTKKKAVASLEKKSKSLTSEKENPDENKLAKVTKKATKKTTKSLTSEEKNLKMEKAESIEKKSAAEVKKEEKTEIEVKEETSEEINLKVEKAESVEKKTADEVKKEEKTEVEVKEETSEEPEPEKTEEFDWEAYAKAEDYDSKTRKDLEEVYNKTFSSILEKEVVNGTVITLGKREVVVDISYKSDGVVGASEFRYNPELKVGDSVEVYVESLEDAKGQLLLSHKKARSLRAWEKVNEAYDKQEIIKGYVKCRTKGGMIVDVFGIESFLPGSQIDVKPIRDYDIYVNKTMEFKVVKINEEYKNVVVSHKALIEAELELQKAEIISKLEKGQVLEGTVKNITSYGVFIDLGGVDGLIHITDLSWGRVTHPNEIVELDQKINVVILDFDDQKKRIALGLKQLTPHPWDNLDPNLKIGDVVKGKVVVLADYGAFIEIAAGVEGLIHVSEMSWSQHLRSAQDFLSVGDEVEATVLTLEREERKMSLGIKQLQPDPWQTIQEKYPLNSKHKAIVRNFTNFGIFVELEEGVDGLIHISDLSWTKKIKHPAEFTSIGNEIEVVVLEIDPENRRLSLGHKQLEDNPWDVYETVFTVGSVHKGKIIELIDKGAVIQLPHKIEGFSTPRHLVKEDGAKAKLEEELEFKILEFSKNAKRIIVSHARTYEDVQKARKSGRASSTSKKVRRINTNVEKTTLGDISELAALKTQMKEDSKKDEIKAKEKTEKIEKPIEKEKTETKKIAREIENKEEKNKKEILEKEKNKKELKKEPKEEPKKEQKKEPKEKPGEEPKKKPVKKQTVAKKATKKEKPVAKKKEAPVEKKKKESKKEEKK